MKNILKNKRGDDSIPITILTIGIVAVCGFAWFHFISSEKEVRNSFVGLGIIEELNSQIEENYFYGREVGTLSPFGDIDIAMDFAKENKIINRICDCGENCEEYARLIEESSSENGIPSPIILLSLMMQESDCTYNAFSGSSVGLMQINLIHCGEYRLPSNKDECKKQLIENPELNIEVGAKILKEKYNTYKDGKIFDGCSNLGITYTEWDAAIRGYNGWGCGYDLKGNPYTAQDNFVEEVNQRYALLKRAGNYLEKEKTTGILGWKKTNLLFFVEYKGQP